MLLLKLTVKQDSSLSEPEVIVRYPETAPSLDRLIHYIQQYTYTFQVKLEDGVCFIPADDVFYIDSADSKSLLYTKDRVCGLSPSLTELEANLESAGFVRISKNCILNMSFLESVSPIWNHRLMAVLSNGGKLIVTRHYIEKLKEKLEGGT
jgi:DNA-binding LytR/AlgR family response regulator